MREEINLSCGILISRNNPANPRPWNSPKKKMANIFDLLFQKNHHFRKKTEVNATYAIEKAMMGSTIRELSTTIPVPARMRVILCASVNTHVSLRISFQETKTSKSERTKSIWSGQLKICQTQSLKKSYILSKSDVWLFLMIARISAPFLYLPANSGD